MMTKTIDDIQDALKAGEYQSKLPFAKYPLKPRLNTSLVSLTADEAREYANKMDAYTVEYARCKEINDAQDRDQAILNCKFESDVVQLFLDVGATPKQASRAYGIAYDQGHSAGYEEVLNYAIHFLEIWRD
jgi:hypothetical protein